MRKFITAILASTAAAAFMSDIEDVVLVSGKDGPVRVSKSAFDADQASEKPEYSAYRGKAEAEQSEPAGTLLPDGPALSAPSAPNFGGPTAADRLDPLTNAVAPVSHGTNARLVMKQGAKYFIVDGQGEKLDIDGIETGGYKSEELARDAIRKLPSPGTPDPTV